MSIIALNKALLSKKKTGYIYPPNALYPQSEAHTMITTQDYIPVASAAELDALRNSTNQPMGVGTPWEGSYLTGVDKKYLQVADIDLQGSESNKWNRTDDWQGILDGNLLNIVGLYLNQNTSLWGMFLCGATSGDRTFRNMRLDGVNYSISQAIGLLTGRLGSGYLVENCEFKGEIVSINTRQGAIGDNGGLILNCKSSVNVTSSDNYIGSLVGLQLSSGIIRNCHSDGTVVSGTNKGAGLVGGNLGGIIENCYSIGLADKGLVQNNTGTITNSYFNTDITPTSAGGTGKTTAEMQAGTIPDTTIYVGWDDTIWDAGTTSEYPELINLQ